MCIPEEKTGIVPNFSESDAVDLNSSVVQVPCNETRKWQEWTAKNRR